MKKVLYAFLVVTVAFMARLALFDLAKGSEYSELLAAITAVDNFVDTEITTIDGVVDDLKDGDPCTIATVDGGLGRCHVTVCTSVDGSVAQWDDDVDYAIFDVTGTCLVKVVGVVVEAITEGNGDETVSLGTTGIAGNIMAAEATPATDWGVAGAPVGDTDAGFRMLTDTEIDVQVLGTTGINDGVIQFYALWYPISGGASGTNVDSTGWN